ncbi:MAG: hypothetical protein ACHQFZ_06655 [Acidimicrobiales bacterium]
MSPTPGYSEVANSQLDEIENGGDADLYDAILDVCEFVLAEPGKAQARSSALTTAEGIRFRFAVPGHYPYKVFWSSDGPRIEAVFPYP